MNHGTRDCPELSKDLDTGFYKSSGGAHNHGGGDDDESIRLGVTNKNSPPVAVIAFIRKNPFRVCF